VAPTSRALESTRLQLPRWITALFVAIIAIASAVALIVPQLQQREYVGQTRVGVITNVVEAPDTAGRVGSTAPDFLWLQPSGDSTRLTALRGTPVVLNFWATWCVSCRAEMPLLEQTARDNPGIAFYEIDLDEDGGKVRGFFDSLEIEHLVPLVDVGNAVALAYGLGQGVPTSFFIDSGGVVRAVALGPMDTATLAKNLSTVTQ